VLGRRRKCLSLSQCIRVPLDDRNPAVSSSQGSAVCGILDASLKTSIGHLKRKAGFSSQGLNQLDCLSGCLAV